LAGQDFSRVQVIVNYQKRKKMKKLEKTLSIRPLTAAMIVVIGFALVSCGDDEPKATTGITIKSMTPASPATLKYFELDFNDRITITYDYLITEPDGARIWIQGVASDGSSGSIYSPSPIYKGSGSKTVVLSYDSDEPSVHIEKLRIKISKPDQSADISVTFVDVDYTFTE
jgi:hypothetical protein